jgi:SulP family sulfate permease
MVTKVDHPPNGRVRCGCSGNLLREYTLEKFVADLIAGVTVGLVALPLAMAFAIASGVSPQAGIYCAVVTGFLISALGGSKTQIGGPSRATALWFPIA